MCVAMVVRMDMYQVVCVTLGSNVIEVLYGFICTIWY